MNRIFKKITTNINLYQQEMTQKGFSYLFKARFQKFILDPFSYYHYRMTKAHRIYLFQKKRYRYLIDRYNFTWRNERTVEIPIVWRIIKQNRGKQILEIGNVLAHYYHIHHTVVDKYEKAPQVINEDVVSYNPRKKFDLIVAISTLEHVGWDEQPKEPRKIIRAVKHLRTLLKKNGLMIITLPMGYYNKELITIINNNDLQFSKQYFLKRISKDNLWKETSYDEMKAVRYNTPFPHANAILVGFISQKNNRKPQNKRN